MKKVLICIPNCPEDRKEEFDEIREISNFLNTEEVSKNPMGYLKQIMTLLKSDKDEDMEKLMEVSSKLLNKEFIDSLSNNDVEIHLCVQKKSVQGIFISLITDTIKDRVGHAIEIEKEC